MSNDKVVEDVKTPSIDQDVKAEVIDQDVKTDDYSVPGYRFKELNDKNKSLEAKLKDFESKHKAKIESEAEEREEFKELYEKTKVERDKFSADAEKYYSIERDRKERLLEDFPESLRSKLEILDSEALEQMKTEFTNKVPQVDNSGGGVSSGKPLEWSKLPPSERKKHFADIMRNKS